MVVFSAVFFVLEKSTETEDVLAEDSVATSGCSLRLFFLTLQWQELPSEKLVEA